ncbi:MAG: carbon monoxide dehydrogenase [Candidatus Omnitrophica bacterium CG07_land_8_20_14_0_80_42_15]|uniref:Carbon monoxide dehydrogenase n=1 Tax=Candidatus Aquitaenariimonas noxiae TaxID=1974741 RepID=A0A2J0KU87_9BACT|nr:MAG: carbon monoxide dehydrogenase [Candidatus Omnitrophica bacterium CG07_land_8_20_14_0_80_42_15]
MRIAFTGKGGVGKTTLAALFIRSLANDNRRVLAVDCDPDSNLAAALGFPDGAKIKPISMMKDLIHERMEMKKGEPPIFYKLNPNIDDIPKKFVKRKNSIDLINMGTVEKGGSGCVCPESTFMRNLLSEIVLSEGEDIVLDMDPGIEHLGRRTAKSVDGFITVVEPSINSVETAKKIKKLAGDIGVKSAYVIGNKIKDAKDKKFIESNFQKEEILGMIPHSENISDLDKKSNRALNDKRIIDEVDRIKNILFKEEKYAGK